MKSDVCHASVFENLETLVEFRTYDFLNASETQSEKLHGICVVKFRKEAMQRGESHIFG